MSSMAEEILEQALALPEEERETLLGALANSLQGVELSPEWQDEILRRFRKLQSGDAVLHDPAEHLQAVRAKLGG